MYHKIQFYVLSFYSCTSLTEHDLPNGLKSNAKLFADDTSLFTIVKGKIESANILNDDLQLISNEAYKWKSFFNQNP